MDLQRARLDMLNLRAALDNPVTPIRCSMIDLKEFVMAQVNHRRQDAGQGSRMQTPPGKENNAPVKEYFTSEFLQRRRENQLLDMRKQAILNSTREGFTQSDPPQDPRMLQSTPTPPQNMDLPLPPWGNEKSNHGPTRHIRRKGRKHRGPLAK
uniref:Ribosome biogenesis protein ERB1 n=1 Tax=Lygus hesperus TaxID=30085 RepID=A0A0A9ZGV6_LYGHE